MAAQRLAEDTGARFLALECQAGESLIRERLSERHGEERVVSDGRWEIYQAQRGRHEPVDELPADSLAVVSTEQPLRQQIEGVLEQLG